MTKQEETKKKKKLPRHRLRDGLLYFSIAMFVLSAGLSFARGNFDSIIIGVLNILFALMVWLQISTYRLVDRQHAIISSLFDYIDFIELVNNCLRQQVDEAKTARPGDAAKVK